MLQKFELESAIGPAMVDGQLIKTLKHETVPGVYTYEFQAPKVRLFFAVSGGILREASYQLSSIFPWVRKKCIAQLLEAYGLDGDWKPIRQDRFGTMYRSQGGLYYAAVGKGSKFLTVGSMLFHEEKFRIVS